MSNSRQRNSSVEKTFSDFYYDSTTYIRAVKRIERDENFFLSDYYILQMLR